MNRAQRLRVATLLRASKRAESRYASDLRAIMAGVHAGYMAALRPVLASRGPSVRHDSLTRHEVILGDLAGKVQVHVAARVGVAFDRMAEQVQKSTAAAAKALGLVHVGLKRDAQSPQVLTFREQNIQLMQKAVVSYADQARAVLNDPANDGLRIEELTAKLVERGVVSESRAELIARDQTLKLNAQLNQDRQVSAGVDSYVWSGSLDERERPIHRELEGQTFSWNTPPVTAEDGERNHPGEDIQCRCVALPAISGLEDL